MQGSLVVSNLRGSGFVYFIHAVFREKK